jgi:hypothetical protein
VTQPQHDEPDEIEVSESVVSLLEPDPDPDVRLSSENVKLAEDESSLSDISVIPL